MRRYIVHRPKKKGDRQSHTYEITSIIIDNCRSHDRHSHCNTVLDPCTFTARTLLHTFMLQWTAATPLEENDKGDPYRVAICAPVCYDGMLQ